MGKAGAEIAEFEIAHVRAMKKFTEKEQIGCYFTSTRSFDVWCNEEAALKAKAVYDYMVSETFGYIEDVVFYTGDKVERMSNHPSGRGVDIFMLTRGRYVVLEVPWHVHRTPPERYGHINSLCTWFRNWLLPIKPTSEHIRQSYPSKETKRKLLDQDSMGPDACQASYSCEQCLRLRPSPRIQEEHCSL